ncbi:hypothetical protein I302_103888 [Kwoniella bestiolae CBS 10118]|uniref:Uncharacterized protein n=1 Tax=Kwoniella bestiolae CBS 10118 TaxID=1296100 RepID=A0A1B9G9P2_9TREE|nr:hypothetical protein I302_02594 [Kwoniella bestiolae CBS 10118]OCF27748.1 hypothetical protein I302_02594 [Kwoniella bestiolae CBS 10118]
MQGDIVVISDTEEVSDEEIAFVGITQTQPKARIGQGGPSRQTITPIFIDSDPPEPEPEDDQDICAFLSSTIDTSTSIAGPSLTSARTTKLTKLTKDVDRKGKRRADEDVMMDINESIGLMNRFEKFENSILSKIDSLAEIDVHTDTPDTLIGDIPAESAEQPTKKKAKKRKSSSTNDDTTTEKRQKSSELDPVADLAQLKTKLTKEEKEALKAREKAEKQLQKDTLKAAKEAEKSYQRKLAEVNRLRVSKNDTVREIHLHLSSDLSHPTSPIAPALPEITKRITDNYSELHFLSEEESPVAGLIKFKRHLKARWDGEKKQFIPLESPVWVWEGIYVLVFNAEEIVDKISPSSSTSISPTEGGGEEDGLDELNIWVSDIKLTLDLTAADQLIIVIKGLNRYYSKMKSLANRRFTAAARAGLNGSTTTTKTTSGASVGVDKETVEMALVRLQVRQRCFLVHVEKTEDIEDWVYNIAADVAIRPYKLISKSHLNFCPTDGIKKGSNPTETFELMLQEVQGITPSASMGIASEYPTFRGLMESFEKAERRGGVERAEGMLQDCQIKTLRNGTANGRKLNKALAKRVYNVFRGEDSLALA